ncbi:hypothetical protein AAZV13_06G149500 [Glycine max]
MRGRSYPTNQRRQKALKSFKWIQIQVKKTMSSRGNTAQQQWPLQKNNFINGIIRGCCNRATSTFSSISSTTSSPTTSNGTTAPPSSTPSIPQTPHAKFCTFKWVFSAPIGSSAPHIWVSSMLIISSVMYGRKLMRMFSLVDLLSGSSTQVAYTPLLLLEKCYKYTADTLWWVMNSFECILYSEI